MEPAEEKLLKDYTIGYSCTNPCQAWIALCFGIDGCLDITIPVFVLARRKCYQRERQKQAIHPPAKENFFHVYWFN